MFRFIGTLNSAVYYQFADLLIHFPFSWNCGLEHRLSSYASKEFDAQFINRLVVIMT